MEERTALADWDLSTGAGPACAGCQPVETDEAVHQAATSGQHADLALCLLKGGCVELGMEGKLDFKTGGCLYPSERVSDLTLIGPVTTNRPISGVPFCFGSLRPSSYGRKYNYSIGQCHSVMTLSSNSETIKLEMEKRK